MNGILNSFKVKSKRTKTKIPIFRPSMILLVILFVVLGSVASYLVYTRHRDLTKSALTSNQTIVSLAAVTMSGKLDKVVDVGTALSTKTALQQYIRDGNWVGAANTLSVAQQSFPYLATMSLMDMTGTVRSGVPSDGSVSASTGQNFAGRDYFQMVSRTGKPYVGQALAPQADLDYSVVPVAIPVTSPSGERLAILVLTLKFDAITSWTKSIDAGHDGIVYIVDQKGHLVAHPKLLPAPDLVDFSSVSVVQKIMDGKHGAGLAYNRVEKVERVAAYQPVTPYGWGIVVAQPAAAAFRERDNTVKDTIVLWAFIIAALECATYFLLRNRDTIKAQLDENKTLSNTSAIIKYSEDAIIAKTLDGTVISWNKSAERIYGYSAEEMIGQSITKIVPKDRHKETTEILDHIQKGERIEHYETVRRRKNGSMVSISLSASPIKDSAGKITGAAVIARDITEREKLHRAETRLVSVNTLKEANRELEAFSYSVSHDLRAPLRAIDGFSKILKEDYAEKLGPDGKHLIDTIVGSSQRMGNLIDDLLAFSRLGRQDIKKQRVDMNQLIKEIYTEQRKIYPKRKVRLELGVLPAAQADRALMRQVWVNLISNAFKYTKNKANAVIEIAAESTGADTVYSIRDNGAGFDMAYVDKLFGVFQRLHAQQEFEGTGVGLAIVKRIVTKHGGTVRAEGKVDEGATMYVSFPKKPKK